MKIRGLNVKKCKNVNITVADRDVKENKGTGLVWWQHILKSRLSRVVAGLALAGYVFLKFMPGGGGATERNAIGQAAISSLFSINTIVVGDVFGGRQDSCNLNVTKEAVDKITAAELDGWAKKLCAQKQDSLAFTLYKYAAEKGEPGAQFNLSLMYFWGKGTEKNEREFFIWCRRAAEQGHLEALCELGIAYFRATGTPRNLARAADCIRRSAEGGYVRAQTMMGFMCIFGPAFKVKEDYSAAIQWMNKAAAQNDPMAYFQLGWVNLFGIGVESNVAESLKWLGRARMAGDPEVAKLANDLVDVISKMAK